MVDSYTKILLSIIAACLLLITLKLTVPSVQAYGSGEEVRITNLETDMRSGETLYVYCKNCDD